MRVWRVSACVVGRAAHADTAHGSGLRPTPAPRAAAALRAHAARGATPRSLEKLGTKKHLCIPRGVNAALHATEWNHAARGRSLAGGREAAAQAARRGFACAFSFGFPEARFPWGNALARPETAPAARRPSCVPPRVLPSCPWARAPAAGEQAHQDTRKSFLVHPHKAYHLLLREELLLRVWHGLRGERVLRKSPRRRRLLLVHGGRLPCQSAGDDLQSFGIRPAAPRAPRLNASRRPPPARPPRRAITGRPSSHTHEPAGAHAPPRGSLSCVCRLADSELTGQALIYLSVYPNKRLIKHADSIRLSLQLAGAASVQLMRAGAPNRRS